jgi:hypothetical protein
MHLLYLVGEVEKEDLMMVSLEWNTLFMGGIECCSWGNFPSPRAQSQQRPHPGPCEGRPAGPSRGDALSLQM